MHKISISILVGMFYCYLSNGATEAPPIREGTIEISFATRGCIQELLIASDLQFPLGNRIRSLKYNVVKSSSEITSTFDFPPILTKNGEGLSRIENIPVIQSPGMGGSLTFSEIIIGLDSLDRPLLEKHELVDTGGEVPIQSQDKLGYLPSFELQGAMKMEWMDGATWDDLIQGRPVELQPSSLDAPIGKESLVNQSLDATENLLKVLVEGFKNMLKLEFPTYEVNCERPSIQLVPSQKQSTFKFHGQTGQIVNPPVKTMIRFDCRLTLKE